MAITQNTYTGNGSTTLYSFTFPYLDVSDIKVTLNGVLTTAYTLANATTIQFNSAPANGAAIRIYRQTDDTSTKATFFPGSAIRSQDLNDNFLQVLYKSQETETFAASTDASAVQATANTALSNSSTALSNSNTALTAANAALPKTGGTITGNLEIGSTGSLTFEGNTADSFETTLAVVDPTADRTITLPNITGTVITNADTGTVTSAMIADGTIVDADINANAEIAVSKLADGTARQLLQTDAAGNGVEWTSNVDIPGTLDVTGAAVFDSTAAVSGDVTIADKIIHAGDTDTAIRFPAADVVAVETSGSERCRVDSSGRLLVGTSSSPGVGFGQYARLVVQGQPADNAAGGNISIQRGEAAAGGNITSGEGIGNLSWSDNAGNTFALIGCEADANAGVGDYPGRLVFSTTADGASSPRERFIIPQSGASSFWAPNSAFNVSSGSGAGTSDSVFTGWYGGTGPGAATLGTISVRIWNNGNIVNQNNSYGSLSDLKLKENIVDASSQWDDIKALQVRKYNFKEGQTHTQIGLIAQEVEQVSPGLVSESPDHDAEGNDLGTVTKSVNYSVLYMKAVKALQEAMERIETLEAKVAALDAV